MRYYDIKGGFQVAVSNEEEKLVEKIKQQEKVYKSSLTEREKQLSRILVSRGILNRYNDENGLYFTFNDIEILPRI